MSRVGRFTRLSCAGALTLAAGAAGLIAPMAAHADTPTAPITTSASGTPGITLTASWTGNPTSGVATMHLGILQPANACRTTSSCPSGYPAWQGDLTLTGLAADGLTVSGSTPGGASCSQVTADEAVCHYDFLNNNLKTDTVTFTVAPGADLTSPVSADLKVYGTAPTTTDQCKQGGWASWNTPVFDTSTTPVTVTMQPTFRNQGQCVSSVVANSNAGK